MENIRYPECFTDKEKHEKDLKQARKSTLLPYACVYICTHNLSVFTRVHCVCVCEQFDPELSSRQFGVEVSRLTNDERTVPLVVEKLINYIEMHGLYTEGIYRKSGSTNKIKELKQGLDTGDF